MSNTNAIRAGRAFVELFADDSQLEQGLRRVERRLRAFGKQATQIGRNVALIGGTVLTAFVPAIKLASDMEETMNKFNIVFGVNSKTVKQWSDEFAGDMGRSKKQIADFMASSQDLFVPLGFDAGEAEGLSKNITQLAVDLASFNNMQDEDVLRDLHAALTGSGEVMKKYGVIVSEAAVKQELLNQGMDPKAATDQQKVLARLAIIMRGTTAAQGDAQRSAGSFANQMKRLRAVVDDAAVEIGTALLPIVTPLVKKLADAATFVGQFAQKNPQLITMIAAGGAVLVILGGALMALGVVASLASAGLGAVATVVGVIGAPLLLLITGVSALATWFFTATEAGQQMVSDLMDAFKDLGLSWDKTWFGMYDVFTNISAEIQSYWARLTTALARQIVWLWSKVDGSIDYNAASRELTEDLNRRLKQIRANQLGSLEGSRAAEEKRARAYDFQSRMNQSGSSFDPSGLNSAAIRQDAGTFSSLSQLMYAPNRNFLTKGEQEIVAAVKGVSKTIEDSGGLDA